MFLFSPRGLWARQMRIPAVFSVGAMALFAALAQAQHDHAMPAAPGSKHDSGWRAAYGPGALMPLQFDSVLSRYKPMAGQKLGSWREANETVTRIGGWRTYLKESQQPDTAAPAAPPAVPTVSTTPKAPTPANPHAGHEAKP